MKHFLLPFGRKEASIPCEKMPLLPMKSNLRVLIVRLGAMGDILHALPAVTALRQAHPEWTIGWAVAPQWRSLLAAESKFGNQGREPAMPLVDQLHVVPTKRWGREPFHWSTIREILGLRKELGGAHYDVALDLQGAVRSALFASWAKTPRCIGEEEPREKFARYFFHERVATRGAHVIEQDLELASTIADDKLVHTLPLLPSCSQGEHWADLQLARFHRHPIVIINPGAGWGAKRWPPERYGQVARSLHDLGCKVFLNSGPGEESLAATVYDASGKTAIKLVEATVGQLIALIRRASLVIAGDTGPLHLACALGKPVVGIFGPTDPKRNGPFGCNFRVLRHPDSKRDHTRRSEPEAGLLTITPQAVLAAAQELLPRISTT